MLIPTSYSFLRRFHFQKKLHSNFLIFPLNFFNCTSFFVLNFAFPSFQQNLIPLLPTKRCVNAYHMPFLQTKGIVNATYIGPITLMNNQCLNEKQITSKKLKEEHLVYIFCFLFPHLQLKYNMYSRHESGINCSRTLLSQILN